MMRYPSQLRFVHPAGTSKFNSLTTCPNQRWLQLCNCDGLQHPHMKISNVSYHCRRRSTAITSALPILTETTAPLSSLALETTKVQAGGHGWQMAMARMQTEIRELFDSQLSQQKSYTDHFLKIYLCVYRTTII